MFGIIKSFDFVFSYIFKNKKKLQRAVRVLECTVNGVGYRPNWGKGNICVYFWTDVLKWQAYLLRKTGGNSAIRQINWRLLQCTHFSLSH